MPKLCEFENCRKQASYSYFFQKPERCKEHKEDRKKQYHICRCGNTRPIYGLPTDKRPSYCIKCKNDKMINISTKKCLENKCIKQPSFNFKGKKIGLYCKNHAKENMIYITINRCRENKCTKQPNFNFEGEKKGIYCSKHAKENMIKINTKKC